MRTDTKVILERKLGYGEGHALAAAIEGGAKIGDRLERKLGYMMGDPVAARNFSAAIHSHEEALTDNTMVAVNHTFGSIAGSDICDAIKTRPAPKPKAASRTSKVAETPKIDEEITEPRRRAMSRLHTASRPRQEHKEE